MINTFHFAFRMKRLFFFFLNKIGQKIIPVFSELLACGFKKNILKMFIWLPQVLVLARGSLMCGVWALVP